MKQLTVAQTGESYPTRGGGEARITKIITDTIGKRKTRYPVRGKYSTIDNESGKRRWVVGSWTLDGKIDIVQKTNANDLILSKDVKGFEPTPIRNRKKFVSPFDKLSYKQEKLIRTMLKGGSIQHLGGNSALLSGGAIGDEKIHPETFRGLMHRGILVRGKIPSSIVLGDTFLADLEEWKRG